MRQCGDSSPQFTLFLIRLIAPFASKNKAEVVRVGLELGAPYALTWSCYEGGEHPCGDCGTCRDRAAAFAANGAEDPALAAETIS